MNLTLNCLAYRIQTGLKMDSQNALAYFLFLIAISFCDAQGDHPRDSSRPHRPPKPFTPQTPIISQPTIQVLGIPIVPALNLAGGIVGSVLAATRPREPPFAPFSCVGRVPGYYADITTNCKNYYTCTPRGRQYFYRCGERTIFNQLYLTCDHRRNYDCQRALQDYSVNEQYRPFRTHHQHGQD